ncbi:MAG: hypothetical protein Q8P67_06075 [archaeon]|nr:hypothetical protein [archaeon]
MNSPNSSPVKSHPIIVVVTPRKPWEKSALGWERLRSNDPALTCK